MVILPLWKKKMDKFIYIIMKSEVDSDKEYSINDPMEATFSEDTALKLLKDYEHDYRGSKAKYMFYFKIVPFTV